jgi:hypothetical protein
VHILRRFIFAQAEVARLTQPQIIRPLFKANLDDELRPRPVNMM